MIILGIDWARSKHDLVFMLKDGQVVQRMQLAHNAQSLEQLVTLVAQYEPDPQQVRVAIEMHDGALLAFLLGQGYTVFGINPKSANRVRESYRPAGGKDDASDAFILADMLRTDRGRLRSIRKDSDATIQLRSLVELRQDRVRERAALFNRLRARLDEWCPELSRLCDAFARIWQRRLLERFPMQQDLHQTHGQTIRAFVRRHHLRSETAERIKAVHLATPMPVPVALEPCLRLDIQHLLRQIEGKVQAIDELEQLIQKKLAGHPDAQMFQSLPVKGANTIATLLAGFGENREKAAKPQQLAAAWGVAPLTIQSGKYRCVRRRHAADQTLSQALLRFAFITAFMNNCWASDFYQRKRSEGKAHYTALRCLAQRWIKILHRMWKDRIQYDEQRHRNKLQLAANTTTEKPND